MNNTQKETKYKVHQQQLWQVIVEAGLQQAQEGIQQFEEPKYLEQQAIQEQVCVAYIAKAMKDLGIFTHLKDKFSVDKIFAQFPIKPGYRQLLTRWLEVLVERGILQREGEQFFHLQVLNTKEFDTLLQTFQNRFAKRPEQARLIQSFGNRHVPLLKGEEIGQSILFANGDLDVYAKLEKESGTFSSYTNAIMRAIIQKMLSLFSYSDKLRILEIGAGQGLSTNWLLPIFPPEYTHYTYTDISPIFLKFGKNKFERYPFIEYRLFNMEKSLESQRVEINSYDIVIATNAMHVTNNIGATLDRVRSLLTPAGLFLFTETTQPNLPFDVIYGLLMPSFEDPSFAEGVRNTGKPFLNKEQWYHILKHHGFTEVKYFPESDISDCHVILAM